MTFSLSIPRSLNNFMAKLGGAARASLFAVAGNAVTVLVRQHLAIESTRRHFTAARLGATPTGHLEQAARMTTFSSDSSSATIHIPGAGISRAFADITLNTPTPTGKHYYTIPISRYAYAKRISELRAYGWRIFRPGRAKILIGYNSKGDKPTPLYILAAHINQKQDRSLLPSDQQLSAAASTAIITELNRIRSKD